MDNKIKKDNKKGNAAGAIAGAAVVAGLAAGAVMLSDKKNRDKAEKLIKKVKSKAVDYSQKISKIKSAKQKEVESKIDEGREAVKKGLNQTKKTADSYKAKIK